MSRRVLAARRLWPFAVMLGVMACEPSDPTPVGRGARIFKRTCSGCHGPDGKGVMRLGLPRPPRDLTDAAFHAKTSDEELRRVIRVGKGLMPAFGGLLGDEDLANVIAFVRTLPPGGYKPPTAPAPAAPPSAVPPSAVPPSAAPSSEPVPAAGDALPAAPAPTSAQIAPTLAPEKRGVVQ